MTMKYIGIFFLFIQVAGCTSGNNSQMLKAQLDEVTTRLRVVENTNSGIRNRLKNLETDVAVLKDRMSVLRHNRSQEVVVNKVPDMPVERLQPPVNYNENTTPTTVHQGLPTTYDTIDDEGQAHPYQARIQPPEQDRKVRVKVNPSIPKQAVQTPQALYRTAFDAYRHGESGRAIALFTQFLKVYPENDLSDNAMYWLGECYYDKRSFDKAKEFFTNVVTRYPKGNKVADAMLKMGMCNEMQDRFKDAKRLFQAVMLGYPDSSAARIAMDKMQALQ